MSGSEAQSALSAPVPSEAWPALPLEEWKDTLATLHMWTQVVGKVRMALASPVNHWWHVPLYVGARGLTTTAIPYGTGCFEMEFDFREHRLRVDTGHGATRTVALEPRSVADFHRATMAALRELGIEVEIWTTPVEVPDPIPFEEDEVHASYDPEHARRFWRVLLQASRVLEEFRSPFLGKCSPVHFFWGSFDLAVTRFSGRPAPEHPGGVPGLADWVTREAYSHEVSSAGWWPGGGPFPEPAFYAYMYPTPPGYAEARVRPGTAFFHPEMGEFLLPYEAVRTAPSPDRALLEFLQSTYEAGAERAGWDRAALERRS